MHAPALLALVNTTAKLLGSESSSATATPTPASARSSAASTCFLSTPTRAERRAFHEAGIVQPSRGLVFGHHLPPSYETACSLPSSVHEPSVHEPITSAAAAAAALSSLAVQQVLQLPSESEGGSEYETDDTTEHEDEEPSAGDKERVQQQAEAAAPEQRRVITGIQPEGDGDAPAAAAAAAATAAAQEHFEFTSSEGSHESPFEDCPTPHITKSASGSHLISCSTQAQPAPRFSDDFAAAVSRFADGAPLLPEATALMRAASQQQGEGWGGDQGQPAAGPEQEGDAGGTAYHSCVSSRGPTADEAPQASGSASMITDGTGQPQQVSRASRHSRQLSGDLSGQLLAAALQPVGSSAGSASGGAPSSSSKRRVSTHSRHVSMDGFGLPFSEVDLMIVPALVDDIKQAGSVPLHTAFDRHRCLEQQQQPQPCSTSSVPAVPLTHALSDTAALDYHRSPINNSRSRAVSTDGGGQLVELPPQLQASLVRLASTGVLSTTARRRSVELAVSMSSVGMSGGVCATGEPLVPPSAGGARTTVEPDEALPQDSPTHAAASEVAHQEDGGCQQQEEVHTTPTVVVDRSAGPLFAADRGDDYVGGSSSSGATSSDWRRSASSTDERDVENAWDISSAAAATPQSLALPQQEKQQQTQQQEPCLCFHVTSPDLATLQQIAQQR